MDTVKQPSARPTNKMLAFTIGSAIGKLIEVVASSYWPILDDPAIWAFMPELVDYLVPLVVGFVAAWQTGDRPNVDPYAPDDMRGV